MRKARLLAAVTFAAGLAAPFATAHAAPPEPPPIYWTCRPYIGPDGEVGWVC